MSYIVLGHAEEHIDKSNTVPSGCMLILSEECGIEGTFPHFLYDVFSDEANTEILNNPLKHKTALEKLFKKQITIYKEFEECPHIEFKLLGYSENTDRYGEEDAYNIEPSGIFTLPAERKDWLINPSSRGIKRYTQRIINPMKPEQIQRTFQGAIYPQFTPKKEQTINSLLMEPELNISQESLFKLAPGIYYNFLCRTFPEEQEIIDLLKLNANSYDHIALINNWLKTKKAAKLNTRTLTRIKSLVNRIKDIRAKSRERRGYSIGNKVDHIVNLLLAKDITAKTKHLIANLDKDLLNAVDSHNGYTVLFAAVKGGHTSIVKELLASGADPNISDFNDITPLMVACSESYMYIVSALINGSAVASASDHDGTTALHIAVSKNDHVTIMRILKAGGDPNARDEDGDTPLHIAAGHNMTANLRTLITAGGNINAQNNIGITPLMEAIHSRAINSVQYLTKKSDLSLRSSLGTTALGYALNAKMGKLVKQMILLGAPVKKWELIRDVAKQYKMDKLLTFVQTIINHGSINNIPNIDTKRKALSCLEKGRNWVTRKCLKHCDKRNSITHRCKK